ncbi:hypothetical protein OAK81_01150 [Verrucomicrobiales bacterium]|nr:hypothetical protein [Verrucomicrobiales bacterium]
MRPVTFSKIPRSIAAFSLCSLILSSCGEKETGDAPAQPASEPPAASVTPAPAKEVLPSTGQISTSAPGVPTSQITQTQPRSQVPPQPTQKRVQLTPEQQEQVVNQVMVNQAKAQAAGLGNGYVKVNKAWNYNGYSTLEIDKGSTIPARLVAVDLTVEGHTVNFDYDDIEIIDGVTGLSYGSDPFVVFLDNDGKPLTEDAHPPVAPAPIRVLLVYAFPKATPTFSLAYWHKNIVREQRIEFEEEGWSVPYPKNSGVQ